ncbi:hypothetical protein ABZ499_29270 [Streptomyces sp. NPDC019990]|uniref:hypothetical protein n=1 Tax=Streptomyces sp. NPDC019990 TaxID=3154693 RepID=UPI0033E1B571
MTEAAPATSQRADLEQAVRTYGGYWDTERSLRTLRDAGRDPQGKHTPDPPRSWPTPSHSRHRSPMHTTRP